MKSYTIGNFGKREEGKSLNRQLPPECQRYKEIRHWYSFGINYTYKSLNSVFNLVVMLTIIWIFLFSGQLPWHAAPDITCHSTEKKTSMQSHYGQSELLLSLFPDELRGINRGIITLNADKSEASAIYGHNQFRISVQDDALKNYKGVQLFEQRYANPLSVDTDSLAQFTQVRSGFKTLNQVDKTRRQSSITFVYEKRYIIRIEGLDHQTPYRLWKYMELHKLKLPDPTS